MGYPISDIFSGRPAGSPPFIQTLARRRTRKRLKPRYVIIVPAGSPSPAPTSTTLFLADVRMAASLARLKKRKSTMCSSCYGDGCAECNGEGYVNHATPDGVVGFAGGWLPTEDVQHVDIYRGQAANLANLGGRLISEMQPLPVSQAELDACAECAGTQRRADAVRSLRGDLLTIPWLVESPSNLSFVQANEAGLAGLNSGHLYCGVREVRDRWEYYRGLGSYLVIEGTTDTRPEAEVMARACMMRAWLNEIERIRSLRGGDLSWGWPLPGPVGLGEPVGDPQKDLFHSGTEEGSHE